ncbi:uncharacterized protein SRS1_16327 [Sporisorium reilianum f. sp. reilianum]|uniref:Uncharacterized protein n=1 Tax=Sporisorium reilianum f. sp. reilianum TaxID=72559 RepID=A0A2N8ULS8_9BASI|nr:uncharacterized protein SRS1_16327 [Sporisorium reilianum f. sp. reilianum]
MSATQATPSGSQDTQPLVHILDDGSQLDEWLASHPPSRLNVPPAFNNGVSPRPVWVLGVPSVDQLAELAPSIAADKIFEKANELVRDATAKVSRIQNDDEIPVRSQGKSPGKSKKQCRTEVQEAFHDQIIMLTAEHPLWNQGRWTIIVKPAQIDGVYTKLAKSLVSGELHKHGSILGFRARTLPFDESTYDYSKSGPKRPKTSRGRRSSAGSSKSPGSAFNAPQTALGIDVFFRPIWNSAAARDVLKLLAGVSGKMPSFCKSSLYSRLGIKSDHQLFTSLSLYSAKTLASPADARLWVREHGSDDTSMDTSSQVDEAESSSRGQASASSPATVATLSDRPDTVETNKRELEQESTGAATVKADEPAHKKARNGESDADKQQSIKMAVDAPSAPAANTQASVDESQDEPMLPVRPSSPHTEPKVARGGLPLVFEPAPDPPAATSTFHDLHQPDVALESTTSCPPLEPTQVKKVVEDSQTQVEMTSADAGGPAVAHGSSVKVDDQVQQNESSSSGQKKAAQEHTGADTESRAEKNGSEVKATDQPEQKPAGELQEVPAANNVGAASVSVLMASEVKTESTPSFTPAFGDDVEKPFSTVGEAQQAEKPKATPAKEALPGLSDLIEEVAEPIALQSGSSGDVKGKEEVETRQSKNESVSKLEVPAGPSKQQGTADAGVGDKATAQQTEAIASVVVEYQQGGAIVVPSSKNQDEASSAELQVIVESSREVPEPAAQGGKDAAHGDTTAQATKKPAGDGEASLSTSAPETAGPTAKPDDTKAQSVEAATTTTTATVKVDSQAASAGSGAEMTIDELIVEGATTSPVGDEEGEGTK